MGIIVLRTIFFSFFHPFHINVFVAHKRLKKNFVKVYNMGSTKEEEGSVDSAAVARLTEQRTLFGHGLCNVMSLA